MVVAPSQFASLERRRRLLDVNYTVLSRLSGVRYKPLRRFFKENGKLALQDLESIDAALRGLEEAQEAGSAESTSSEARSA